MSNYVVVAFVHFNDGVNMISLILVWILHDAFYATEIFGDAIHHLAI
jgi:hypothetical protein